MTRRAGIGLALLAGALLLIAHPSAARAAGPAPSSISISAPSSAVIGQEVVVKARLTSNGKAVTSRVLSLSLDGKPLRTGSVDSTGTAAIPIRAGELEKAHVATITVSYAGTRTLAASSASARLTVKPATLTVATIPAIDGIPIKLGSLTGTTKNGVATIAVPQLGTYQLVPDIVAASTDSTRADFVRWGDNVFTASRSVDITGDMTLQLGLHVAYRGSLQFVTDTGQPIDPSRVESVTLTSSGGSQLVITRYTDVWLEAGTAVKQLDSLAESTRSWRVASVTMRGSNVVTRGQQRLDPAPNATWKLELLLYGLHVEAHDAIFGMLLSGNVELVYPDGTIATTKIEGSTPGADFSLLPRGDYTIRFKTAGLLAPTPVVLSQDQTASIRVITYVDIAFLGAIGLLLIAMLLWFGRRDQVLSTWHRTRAFAVAVPRNGARSATSFASALRSAGASVLHRGSARTRAAGGKALHAVGAPGERLRSAGAARLSRSAEWARARASALPIPGLPAAPSVPVLVGPPPENEPDAEQQEKPATPTRRRSSSTSGSTTARRRAAGEKTEPATSSTAAAGTEKPTTSIRRRTAKAAAAPAPARGSRKTEPASSSSGVGSPAAAKARTTRSSRTTSGTAKATRAARTSSKDAAEGGSPAARKAAKAEKPARRTKAEAKAPARAKKVAPAARASAARAGTASAKRTSKATSKAAAPRKAAATGSRGKRQDPVARAADTKRPEAAGRTATRGTAKSDGASVRKEPARKAAPRARRSRTPAPAPWVNPVRDGSLADQIMRTIRPEPADDQEAPGQADGSQQPVALAADALPTFCTHCHRPVPAHALFCRTCGTRVRAPERH